MYVFGSGGVWGEWIRGLGLGSTNPVGTGGVLGVCLCCSGVGGGSDQGLEGCCYVCVSCESGLFVYIAGPSICILC